MVAALALLPGSLTAQGYASPGRGYAELSMVRVSFSGDSMASRVRPGFGLDAAGTFPAVSRLVVAIGFQYSSHPTTDASDNLKALQLYAEPRFVLMGSGPVIPYVFAHVGLLRWSQDICLIDASNANVCGNAVQSGSAFGGGAGVMIRVVPRVFGYLNAGFQRVSVGDIAFDGAHVPISSVSATNLVLRAGGSFEFSEIPSALRTYLRR